MHLRIRRFSLPYEMKAKDVESISVFIPSPKKKSRSRERQKLTILMKAMTSKKSTRWSSKRWQANAVWKPGPLSTGGCQSSQQQWKETPKVLCEMGLLIKEPKATWHKSCNESQIREENLLVIAEELRTQGSKYDRNRTVLVNGLRRPKKNEKRGEITEQHNRRVAGKSEDP